jgi:hypothetical protein
MKYPERLGRRGARPFHTAIATTFSVEFSAFEEIMLPQLMGSGATNVLMIADGRMASMSMSDLSHLPMQLGRDYEMVSPHVLPDGVFHPKIVLQLGRRSGRLFVGSANVTAAGIAGNAETIVELECTDEPSAEREIIRLAWRYVLRLLEGERGGARDSIEWAAQRTPWLVGPEPEHLQVLEDGTALSFLASGPRQPSISARFMELVGNEKVDRLLVISPYWDNGLQALGDLVERLAPATTSVFLDVDNHQFPFGTDLPPGLEFRNLPSRMQGRFAHAKVIIASTAKHDHVLIGSANCTVAAIGRADFSGSNAEACLYQRLDRESAVTALDLLDCLAESPLDPASLERREPEPPIPLNELASRRVGTFELEGTVLTWRSLHGSGTPGDLELLDTSGAAVELIAFEAFPQGAERSFGLSTNTAEAIAFVVVRTASFVGHPTHVTHRSWLRGKRREAANGVVAKAIAAFDGSEDFDLWMHQSFDQLARADMEDQLGSPGVARPSRAHIEKSEEAPRQLSYEEFMETRTPDGRDGGRRDSTLAGTHSDSIRSFLNLLAGRSPASTAPMKTDDDWMSLGDEDAETELDEETRKAEAAVADTITIEDPVDDIRVDVESYANAVQTYVANVTADDRPLGPNDVLRLRFWLMLLVQKARHERLKNGLPTNCDELGWPRMVLRVIAAFFIGKQPPITRLMISSEYTAMPPDFLESWTTALWALGLIDAALGKSPREVQLRAHANRLRAHVIGILGLTSAELSGAAVVDLVASLDRTMGNRVLEHAAAPDAPAKPIEMSKIYRAIRQR